MAQQMQIKIGPSFFAKAKNDYSNWYWAWVRELCQNSIDAPGCNKIDFTFAYNEEANQTLAVCMNNGSPMTKEILIGKFLSIGESGKNFQSGSVGGFGKAKELIAFCHEEYSIRTGTFYVEGSGAEFTLTEDLEYYDGTTTTVFMKGDQSDDLARSVKRFAHYAQWDGTIELACGDEFSTLTCDMRKGSPRREFEFGKIYTNKQAKNVMVVRIGGIPMFMTNVTIDRCVVLELSGSSVDTLTSNRDGLRFAIRNEVDNFLEQIATDKKAAFKKKVNPRYTKFAGRRFNEVKRESIGLSFSTAKLDDAFKVKVKVDDASEGAGVRGSSEVSKTHVNIPSSGEWVSTTISVDGVDSVDYEQSVIATVSSKSQLDEMFIVKNETDLQIPNHFLPNSGEFGTYSKKLAIIWGKLMLTMHRLFNNDDPFSIGFIFSEGEDGEDTIAEFEKLDDYGNVYYLNPAKVVEQQSSKSRSFKKRFLLTDRNDLIVTALHEFVHGLGYNSHNDSYAYKLTDMMVVVLDNRQKFNWCFV